MVFTFLHTRNVLDSELLHRGGSYSRLMIVSRDSLIQAARNIRLSLPDLSEAEMAGAIREVILHYAPHSNPEDLKSIITDSRIKTAESA